jgi:TPR repeat protein
MAGQGVAKAEVNLGVMYYQGNGELEDDAEAVRWFRLAAEQGDADAQYYLGIMYEFGNGVVKDNGSAHMWSNIGSANGNSGAAEYSDIIEGRMTPEQIAVEQPHLSGPN